MSFIIKLKYNAINLPQQQVCEESRKKIANNL